MDSLLQTLYYAYVFIGGFCSVENVQYQNTKHFVYINTEEYQVRLITVSYTHLTLPTNREV